MAERSLESKYVSAFPWGERSDWDEVDNFLEFISVAGFVFSSQGYFTLSIFMTALNSCFYG